MIGNDAFQEADVTGITRPCTKWNYLVKDVRDLPRIINEAFVIATSGRPGPVLVDLPKDVTSGDLSGRGGRHAARTSSTGDKLAAHGGHAKQMPRPRRS